MSKIAIDAFVSIPPCSGGVAVKRLQREIEAEFGDQVKIAYHTGPGDPEWDDHAINNAPALLVGDRQIRRAGARQGEPGRRAA